MFRRLVIHPVLFAIYPILTLYVYNINQLPFTQILVPSGLVLAILAILFLILNLLIKNIQKSALVLSAFTLQFFAYGHLNDFIRYFALLAFLIGTYYLLRSKRDISNITQIANIFSIGLVVIVTANIAVAKISGATSIEAYKYRPQMVKPGIQESIKKNLPDIYYIILDGYGRTDILQELYNYDNSDFLDYLHQRGFQIAKQSRSNYCQTLLSLTSTLNLIYLDKMAEEIGAESEDRKLLMDMLRHNFVFDFLKQYGYKILATATGYSGTEIRNADFYFSPGFSLNEFGNGLINYTPIPKFLKKFPLINQQSIHRDLVNYSFNKLANIPESRSPYLVLAHIISPHPPFVFGPKGEPIESDKPYKLSDGSHYMELEGASRAEYISKYSGQVRYISNSVKKLIGKLLSAPGPKPIIILQADHGPGSQLDWESLDNTNIDERFSIFNAYYLPGCDSTLIYDSISPVNSFRTIFNHYFGTDFNLLEDRSFYTEWTAPYKFYDVTELMNQDINR